MREIMEMAQQNECARFEEILARTEELKKRHDEEHKTMVAVKQMQQYLASCQDIKQEFSRRCTIDAKQCNVAQMASNEAKKLAEKELDAVWHEIMLKESEVKRHKETEESKRRTLAQQETVSTLAKQVADKLALEDEKKRVKRDEQEHLKRLREDMRRAELKNLEMERQKREKLKKELEEQILTTKKFVAKCAHEETMVDRIFKTLAEEELAKEKVHAKRDILRTELDSYLKYLKDLKQEKVKRNLEMEAIIRQSHKDIEAKRELELKKFKEIRRRAMQEVLRGWEEQLMMRQEAEERERQLKIEEREMLERQIEMNANLTAMEQKENREKALRYGLQLKEQQRCVETTRRHELEKERQYYQAEMKRQMEENQRLTDELLNVSERMSITPHPFKALLKESLKEKEGRPPTLTSA